MAKKLLDYIKKAIIVGTMGLCMQGCPFPLQTHSSPEPILSVSPSYGEAPLESRIILEGKDEEGKEDIVKYKVRIDRGNDGTIDETIKQSTPIDVTRTFNEGQTKIYGQCLDSSGLESEKSIWINVSPQVFPYPGPKTKIAFSGLNYQEQPLNIDLWTINSDGTGLTKIFDGLNYPGRVKFSPEGEYLAFLGEDNKFRIADLDGNVIHEFEGNSSSGRDFTWTPDGNSILCGVYFDGIYRYDLSDNSKHEILNTNPKYTYDHNPVMSPDLEKIVYAHHEYGTSYHIRLMNSPEEITGQSAHDEQLNLTWVDNENFIWKSRGYNGGKIYHYNIPLKEVTEINPGMSFSEIELSPDKDTLAVHSLSNKIGFINVENLDSGIIETYEDSLGNGNFEWSPNGDYFIRRVNLFSLKIYDREGNPYRLLKPEDFHFSESLGGVSIYDFSWSSKTLQ